MLGPVSEEFDAIRVAAGRPASLSHVGGKRRHEILKLGEAASIKVPVEERQVTDSTAMREREERDTTAMESNPPHEPEAQRNHRALRRIRGRHSLQWIHGLDADRFGAASLVEGWKEDVVHNMSILNCVDIWQFAKSFLLQDLQEVARAYLLKNFEAVANRGFELLKLPVEELCSLMELDELNVRNETRLWDLAVRWIEKDPDRRRVHLCELMKRVRWGLLNDSRYFLLTVNNHPLLQDKEKDCEALVINILTFLREPGTIFSPEQEVPTPTFTRPRLPHEILFAIGGWPSDNDIDIVETYDARADRWVQVEGIRGMGLRTYYGCAVLEKDIYIIGGFDGHNFFDSCLKFDTLSKQFTEIAPMNCKRGGVSVAVLDGTIYAMGGSEGQQHLNSVEVYNSTTNQWSLVTPMAVQRSFAGATTLDGRVYVVGGFNGQQSLNSTEYYDPASREWTMTTNMQSNRSRLSCVTYNGHVYAIGGSDDGNDLSSVEKYCAQTNTWSTVASMDDCRSDFTASVMDGRIFAIGGRSEMGISVLIPMVECYDDQTNTWEEVCPLVNARKALCSCVVEDLPNVRDYIFSDREQLAEERKRRLLDTIRRRHLHTRIDF